MSNYGRVKHSRVNVKAAAERHFKRGGPGKRIGIDVRILRMPSYRVVGYQYSAQACLRTVGHYRRRTHRGGYKESCGSTKFARTPQSAMAKALKSFTNVIAQRGRR